MGVPGLLSYCLEHRAECVEFFDLVDVAQHRGGIELLVDFYSFEHLLLKNFYQSIKTFYNNPYSRVCGGDYTMLHNYVTKLITDLKSLDIHLVMFVDGAKGSSKIGTEQKLETWKYRHHQDVGKMKDLLDVLHNRKFIEDIPESSNVRPVLLEIQIFETLKECKCEVVQLSGGEADFVIARNLQNRPRAFAVLSNDSDFCVFNACKFIPHKLFDLQGDLQLGQPQPLPEKPLRMMVGVITATKVVSLLELNDYTELVELSIIGGNDFTGSFMRRLKSQIGLGGRPSMADTAKWVQEHRRVENHQTVNTEMSRNHQFGSAVHRSRQFYNLTLPQDQVHAGDGLSQLVDEGIRQLQYPASVMAMHYGFYWHRMLLEDCGHGHSCAEVTLAPLRSFIYRMLLPQRQNSVMEYGRTPYEELASAPVYAAAERSVPAMNFVQQNKIFQNLRTFHRIMIHQEPHFQTEWYKRYGWKVGFKFYVLRYFLVMNTGQNLHMTREEYMALLAMVFVSKDHEAWYQGIGLRPTARSVTVGNWFQDVYRHAYYFLGKLLQLSHEFSLPRNVFSGSVWTAFYLISTGQVGPADWCRRANTDMKKILGEKKHMLRYVMDGYYNMDA